MKTSSKEISLREVVGKGYDDFWLCKKRYRVLKGGKGSKKSATTALNFVYRLMKYPKANLMVIRQVMQTHRNSTFAQLKWAIDRLGVSTQWRATLEPLELTYLPTGQKIMFRGFDDVLKLASTTVDTGYLCWVWIEEAFEIPDEDAFDKLDLSVPRGTVPEPLFKQTTLTFNPWSENHWLKKRFFDTFNSNTAVYSTNYLDNEFLDETDRLVFERMKSENPRRYAVAGLGEWGVTEGAIFERWQVKAFDKRQIGIIKTAEEKNIDESWKYRHIFGLDYGYTNDPTAFIATAVNPKDRVCYIYDEHYERKMLNCDIAKMIQNKGFAKERIYADSAEPKSNDDLRRMGLTRITACKKGPDSIRAGIAQIQEYDIIVHPCCKNTIAELSSYCWQKDKRDKAQNKPIDSNNHLMDALRYAFEDIKLFHPINPNDKKEKSYTEKYYGKEIVTPNDFLGGWK